MNLSQVCFASAAVLGLAAGGWFVGHSNATTTPATCSLAATPTMWTIDRLAIIGSFSRDGQSHLETVPSRAARTTPACEAGEDTLAVEILSSDGRVLTSSAAGCVLQAPTPVTHTTPRRSSTFVSRSGGCGTPDREWKRIVFHERAHVSASLGFPDESDRLRLRLGEETMFESNVLAEQLRYQLRRTRDTAFLPGTESASRRNWAIEQQIARFERALAERDDRRALQILVTDVCGPVTEWIAPEQQSGWANTLLAVERRLRARIVVSMPVSVPTPKPRREGRWDRLIETMKPQD